jgi:hypothetical protein
MRDYRNAFKERDGQIHLSDDDLLVQFHQDAQQAWHAFIGKNADLIFSLRPHREVGRQMVRSTKYTKFHEEGYCGLVDRSLFQLRTTNRWLSRPLLTFVMCFFSW